MNTRHIAKLARVTIGAMLMASVSAVSIASDQAAWTHPLPDGYPAQHYNFQSAKSVTNTGRGTNDVMPNQSEFRHIPPDGYPAANYGYAPNNTATPAKPGNADQQEFRLLPPDGYPAADYHYKTYPAPAAKLSSQE